MTRAELDEMWGRLATGSVSREEAHAWADPRAHAAEDSEPMVMPGLLLLHGATGATATPSLPELASLLEAWRADCIAYDADPTGWRRTRARWTLQGLNRDHPGRAPAAAAVFPREGILTEEEIREIVSAPPA